MSRTTNTYLPVPYLVSRPKESIAEDNSALVVASYPAANRAIYSPFSLPVTKLVKSLTVYTATASINYDVGIYDSSCSVRLVSSGTQSTIAGITTYTLPTPILIEAGVRYYYGFVLANTSNVMRYDTPTTSLRAAGFAQEALASTVLPATATPAQTASAYHPALFLDFAQ